MHADMQILLNIFLLLGSPADVIGSCIGERSGKWYLPALEEDVENANRHRALACPGWTDDNENTTRNISNHCPKLRAL